MAHDDTNRTDRRKFLQAGAVASAGALSLTAGSRAQEAANKADPLPRRVLGKTGVEVTMLEQGAVRGNGGDRIIRHAFANGVRLFERKRTLIR